MTTTNLVAFVPEHLVNPRTGELVPATPEKAVELLTDVREMRQRMLDLVKDCEAVLLDESRKRGTKTLHFDNVTATVTGGSEISWDVEELHALLAHGLPEERFNELVVATVSYKVNAAVARQLEAANPTYAAVIERARGHVDKPWRVSVK